MSVCKNCGSTHIVKNGFVRKKQRYRCKECGFNFVEGDGRTSNAIAAKKAMLIFLYAMGKIFFNMFGKLFNMWPSQVYRWIVKEGKKLPEQSISGEINSLLSFAGRPTSPLLPGRCASMFSQTRSENFL